ncbi:MAG: hypothetical protein Q8P68_00690 [Candidatus Peregrinibacteria bacterium]|nr:hypothetical protein [Candidatus Peregrinibacteria bacterium]MDZ4245068.1 hypothetical protein [Candidatus Gracilibacteria bacterium]
MVKYKDFINVHKKTIPLMQNFHCQFTPSNSFDSSRKCFSLESRLVWAKEASENGESSPAEIARHAITPEKLGEAIVKQLRKILKKDILKVTSDSKARESTSQEVRIGGKNYTIKNDDLIQLGSHQLTRSLTASPLWDDIKTAIPDISSRKTEIIDLMSLYKISMTSLIPKDVFWLKTLKEGLSETDRTELQELEDAWNETASQDRGEFKKEMEKEYKAAVEDSRRKMEDEEAKEAAKEGRATSAQMREWKNFTDKFKTKSGTVDKWEGLTPELKTLTLSSNDFTDLLSIDDIKETKFIREDAEGKALTFEATPEEIALFEKITAFIGGNLGFGENVIRNMQSQVSNDISNPTSEPEHIKQAEGMRLVLVNLRQFATGSHIFKKILEDFKGKDYQTFYGAFYDNNGKLTKSNSKGLGKYISDLGLKDALTTEEYNKIFLVVCPAAIYQTCTSLKKKEEEAEAKSERKKIAEKEAEKMAKAEIARMNEENERQRIQAQETAEREQKEALSAQERAKEDAKKAEEEAKRLEGERAEAEKHDRELKALKEKVGTASTKMKQYIDTVNPNTTQWVNLKDLSELQKPIQDEEIENANEENTFEDLRKEYIEKAIKIYMRDLRELNAIDFATKVRGDSVYVESKSKVIQIPGGDTTTIPAKKTYISLTIFTLALERTGLNEYKRYYSREAKDTRDALLAKATKAFEIFKKADTPNEDIAPEDLAKPEFAQIFAEFKSGSAPAIASNTPKPKTQEKQNPFDDLGDDAKFTQTRGNALRFAKSGNMNKAKPLYEEALKYVEDNYNLGEGANSVKIIDKYLAVGIEYINYLYKSMGSKADVKHFKKTVERLSKVKDYCHEFKMPLAQWERASSQIHEIKLIKFGTGPDKSSELNFAAQIADPRAKATFTRIESNAIEDTKGEKEASTFFFEGTYTFENINTIFTQSKLTINNVEVSLEKGKKYKIEQKNGVSKIIEIINKGTLPNGDTRVTYKIDDKTKTIVIPKDGEYKVIVEGSIVYKIPSVEEIDVASLNKRLKQLGKIKITEEPTEAIAESKDVQEETKPAIEEKPKVHSYGLPEDRAALAGYIKTTEELYINNGNIVSASIIAETIEKEFPNMEGDAALYFADMCMAIADGLYKQLANDERTDYADVDIRLTEALEYFEKASKYSEVAKATGSIITSEVLDQNLSSHSLGQLQRIQISDISDYKITRTFDVKIDPIDKKISEKISAAIEEINKERKKTKFKKSYIKDNSIFVYVFSGDSINNSIIDTTTKSPLSLKEIDAKRVADLAIAEAELEVETQEEHVAEPVVETEAERITKEFDTKIAYLMNADEKPEVDEMLKQRIDFDQILDLYKLTEFGSSDKKTSYEGLAEKFISLAIDGMMSKMESSFTISQTNNGRRQSWLKDNKYSTENFLDYYFEKMGVKEFKTKLISNEDIKEKAETQLNGSEYVKTALLFDVSISDKFKAIVSKADTKTVGEWIYPDRVPDPITDAGLSKMLAPARYLRWVKEEVFKDQRDLFHEDDRDAAEKIIKDFLIANLSNDSLKKTAEEVNKYEEVPITDLENATKEILATDIFMNAATLESELIEKFENKSDGTKQRLAISSTDGDSTNEGIRFRQLALVAFREKFEHFKNDTNKAPYSSSEALRESWLTVYQAYNIQTFSPKSFEIFELTDAPRHIDRSDPLDKALGDLMRDAVMYFAEIYLKEALQEAKFNGVDFRAKFAVKDGSGNITYDEKAFFRAIAETEIPDAEGDIYASLDYVTHFLNDFDSFKFEKRVAKAINPETKILDTAYVYSGDSKKVETWRDGAKETTESYNENEIKSNKPALDFIKWFGKETKSNVPKKIDPSVLSAMTGRLVATLNNEPVPAEVASTQPEIMVGDEKFTLEAISEAVTKQGLMDGKRWDQIKINDIFLANIMLNSAYVDDAVRIYMEGNKDEANVENRNGFFYRYLRKTYKKKDREALLALTPDKLTDKLNKEYEIPREHLVHNFDVAGKLREYQEETLGAESVTATLEREEDELIAETRKDEEDEKTTLRSKAAEIEDQRIQAIAERLIDSDALAAKTLIKGMSHQESKASERGISEARDTTKTTAEFLNRTPDAEVQAMFDNINAFIKSEINNADPKATQLRAAQIVIKDILINAAHENGIRPPLKKYDLGQVLILNNLRIANHLVNVMQDQSTEMVPEELDQMLTELFEKDDTFRELLFRDGLSLEPLKTAWIEARNKEPQKLTADLLREILLRLPSTEEQIKQIPSEIMLRWYEKTADGELVFKEQLDTMKIVLIILNSFGFRIQSLDPPTTSSENELANEVLTRIKDILNIYHPRNEALGDKNKDGEPGRDYTLKDPYKAKLLRLTPLAEAATFEDASSAEKFETLKAAFFDAIGNVRDRRDRASTLEPYREVLTYLNDKDLSVNTDKQYMTLFYETLMTMKAPEKTEVIRSEELTVREQVIDAERTKLAEETNLQNSLLEQLYRENVLIDAKETIDETGGLKLKDSKVDFSNLQHLSRNVFSEKFRYAVKGGEFLTGKEAGEAYGTALNLLLSSKAADKSIVGFGDFALSKFYKNTAGIDSPLQAKEKFFSDYKDIKDVLKTIAEHQDKNPEIEGFEKGYENEPWYKAYKPLAKRTARILYDQLQRDGVLEKKLIIDPKTLKFLEETLLRGEAPKSLEMMETEMESYMVSSSKIIDVLKKINEEIGIVNMIESTEENADQTRLYTITGYSRLHSPYNDKNQPEYVSFAEYLERLHLLQTQMNIYNGMDREMNKETSPHQLWLKKWKEKSFDKTTKETYRWLTGDFTTRDQGEMINFLNEVLNKYNKERPEILRSAHKQWTLEEIKQARRFDAMHEGIAANNQLNDPRSYKDKRFGTLLEDAETDANLQFENLKDASGPWSEHDIAFNYGLTSENSRLQSFEAVYISNRMKKDFVEALKSLDIRPPEKKQKMIDAFQNNPDDIAKLFYAILGKEETRKRPGFFKVNFEEVKIGTDRVKRPWAVMDIPQVDCASFLEKNQEIIQDLTWKTPTLREIVLAKGTPGFIEFFQRGEVLEHIVYDQSEAAMARLQTSENPLDSLMEYTLRIHEISDRGKSIDRPNRAELEQKAKEQYTDLYEMYVNRDSAWQQYTSNTFVMSNDPELKKTEELKFKGKYADKLLKDGISTMSFMLEYPITWDTKYDRFIDVDTVHNLYEAIGILFAENLSGFGVDNENIEISTLQKLLIIRDSNEKIFDANNKTRSDRMSKLKPRHIDAIATAMQFGKIYKKAIEQGENRKQMVFDIFRSKKDGGIDIASLLKAQDVAFKAKGVDLTADELYKIGDDLRTRLANNTLSHIELSRDMEGAAIEYMDFRTLLAFPVEGYEGIDDEVFMQWKLKVSGQAKELFTERMRHLVAPFIDAELTPSNLDKILQAYVDIQDLKHKQLEIKPYGDEYSNIESEIKNIDKKLSKPMPPEAKTKLEERKQRLIIAKETLKKSKEDYDALSTKIGIINDILEKEIGIDYAVEKLEKLLVNDYGELLRKAVTDLPKIDAASFFGGFGMNVDVMAERAQLGWNAGINLPKEHRIDLMLTVTPGDGAGVQAGGSKGWNELGAEGRGKVQIFAHGGFNAGLNDTVARFNGGVEYSKLEGGRRESRGSIGAFATAEIGPDGIKATIGAMASVGGLSPEEKEIKYKKELKAGREGILKKEYERVDAYVEATVTGSYAEKEAIKKSIMEAMEDVFLRAIIDAEAGRAAMPKTIELTRFEVGVSVGLDKNIATLGLPVQLHMAFVFSVDGRVFVTRVATPEHIMDEASDNEIMRILEDEGIKAGEMTLTSPLTIDDNNMLSSATARGMIERAEDAKDILIKVGEGGEKIYTKKGDEGLKLKGAYEKSVTLGNLEEAKSKFTEDFNKYMDIYRDKIKAAQIRLEPIPGDIHKKRLVLYNTPGITEIHMDPTSEDLMEIDANGNMIFDFASGFPIITKEVFEFEAENYGANTVNIITIKFNRHLSRKQIEASERNYYTVMRNDEDTESKAIKMTPRRAIELDLTMVERAKKKDTEGFFQEIKALYDRSKHIDAMHHKFIDRFGGIKAVDPRYEYISKDRVEDISDAVTAFIHPKPTSDPKRIDEQKALIKDIEKYFTLSIKINEDDKKGRHRLEEKDQLDLLPTQVQETKQLIQLIQKWYKKEYGAELNNYELQYFLGQMVFETFYNIHRSSYTNKSYFISADEIFTDNGTIDEPGKREKLQKNMGSLSNPVYKTMQNYLAHLHGSGRDMARSVAENYVNNHPIQGQEANRDARIKALTESLIGDSEQEVHRLIMEKMELSSIEEAKEYCDYLAYKYFKDRDSAGYDGKGYIAREQLSFIPKRIEEIEIRLKTPETIRAFYGAYENIFEGSQADMIHDENSMLLTRLNASFASARHFKEDVVNPRGWYSAGGRAVEALSANFGGLRKSFIYDLGDPKESEKARAVFEYMRPLPRLGREDGVEYNPLSDVDFFQTGDEDIRFAVRQEEAPIHDPKRKRRISTKSELEDAITKAEKLYEDIEITMQDVKEYLSTPMGLKVLEWAGMFLKKTDADIMLDLFSEVRAVPYDDLKNREPLTEPTKAAFVEFVNINRVLREIEYFNANPEAHEDAFYTVGLGGTEYEAQIRYIPVERIESGVKKLTDSFNIIENDTDFDKNISKFLGDYVEIESTELTKLLDNTNGRANCISYLKNHEKEVGFAKEEIDGLFKDFKTRESALRQFARIIALSKFTPLSKQERESILKSNDATKEISRMITEENEKQYLNQKNSRVMPDGTVQDVVPVAYIFKSSDPENVIIVNAGGISATGTFLKCGNWSTLAQEQLALFVQEQRTTVLDGGGAAKKVTGDVIKPKMETQYGEGVFGVSGGGRLKVTPPTDITHGKNNTDTNSTNSGVNEGYEDIPIDDNGEVDTITGDKGSFTVTPTEAGATTGTSGGKQSPEGISLRRGNQNPETTESKPKVKQPKKKSDDESEEDLSGI